MTFLCVRVFHLLILVVVYAHIKTYVDVFKVYLFFMFKIVMFEEKTFLLLNDTYNG